MVIPNYPTLTQKSNFESVIEQAKKLKGFGYSVYFAETALNNPNVAPTYFYVTNGKIILYIELHPWYGFHVSMPVHPSRLIGSAVRLYDGGEVHDKFDITEENIGRIMGLSTASELCSYMPYIHHRHNAVRLYEDWQHFEDERFNNYTKLIPLEEIKC